MRWRICSHNEIYMKRKIIPPNTHCLSCGKVQPDSVPNCIYCGKSIKIKNYEEKKNTQI